MNNYKIFELLSCNNDCKIGRLSKNSKNELINYINPNSIYGQKLKQSDFNYNLIKNLISNVLLMYFVKLSL